MPSVALANATLEMSNWSIFGQEGSATPGMAPARELAVSNHEFGSVRDV